jgi:hypothetical protein
VSTGMTARQHLRAARHHLTEAVRGYSRNTELDAFTQSCLRAHGDALRAERLYLRDSREGPLCAHLWEMAT